MHIGLDIGSTTLKAVVLDAQGNILYKDYRRHFSKIAAGAADMLGDIASRFGPGLRAGLCVSGSAGMGMAEQAGIPFVQEVYATRIAVSSLVPGADVVIELGGEDAKILFLTRSPGGPADLEVRMNGSCAGGTGAFIDQMATLLGITPDEMNDLAGQSEKTYTVASRCGVFAKSDIQPLINQGARKADISASIFQAVVNQTIAGLAQGRPIGGKVVYLGGPLSFSPALRRCFDHTLGLSGLCPENALYFVALGAAMRARQAEAADIAACVRQIGAYSAGEAYESTAPLFESEAEYQAFSARHSRANVPDALNPDYAGPVYIGMDAGSTTFKAVALDADDGILFKRYLPNDGNPVALARQFLAEFYSAHPRAWVGGSAVTGYGEEIIRQAFRVDDGLVETVAHFMAARKFEPAVDFILDIGGQDIKCFKVRGGAIDNIFLNEACSSGCGSFLQTFAGAWGMQADQFAQQGLFARRPVDLGSRCTVFMNSSVKQAQKDGAGIADISAGLSVSVVKNAVYKVIRAANADQLGRHIVVQGGTFLSDAVLRAFEREIGRQVVRPGIAGLMGAYGAALYARRRGERASTLMGADALAAFEHHIAVTLCQGCQNRCRLTVNTFDGGRRFIGGNRCERAFGQNGGGQTPPNLYAFKRRLLAEYRPVRGGRGRIGLPLGLNFYELLPFWHTVLTALGFEVVTSPQSSRELYLLGQKTIPSDTVCYPAKLLHGHVQALLDQGVDAIFYPCLTYNFDEGLGDNHYNCPVVAYYPEVLAANVPGLRDGRLIYDYLSLTHGRNFARQLQKALSPTFGPIARRDIRAAYVSGLKEYKNYLNKVRKEAESYLNYAAEHDLPVIVLAGRPYHLDEEVGHGIDRLVGELGAVLVSEDGVSHLAGVTPTQVLDQWTYHARLYAAASVVCKMPARINLVQLVSFGCGLDAVTTDETRRILEQAGRIYTQIKIDEITNLGAVKIRLRSLFAALEMKQAEKALERETAGVP